MKILLIAPASGHWRGIARKRAFNGKTFRFSMLSLLTVAALTPPEDEIRVIDEQLQDTPENEDFDLVGLTAMTAAAPRAYELAAHFRRRGIPVVLGGYHATLNPEEALAHVDAVVSGPAAGAWEKILGIVRNGGRPRGLFRGDPAAPAPRALPRHLLAGSNYVTVDSTFATMGCRHTCSFCSVTQFCAAQRHSRAIADVASEVASFGSGYFVFVDDNFTQDRQYALDLLAALAPLGKRWMTQASIETAGDEEMLCALRRAGCVGLFVGLETFNSRSLCAQNKGFNSPAAYAEAVRRIHTHGMFVEAGVVFGFDDDTPDVFRQTLELLDRIGIDAIQASILTPLPGTPLFRTMEDRIFDHDWEHYDYRHAVFHPARMTAEQLQQGADWVIRAFYSPWRIARRSLRWLRAPAGPARIAYPLVINAAYYGRVVRFGIRGRDPAHNRGAWLGHLRHSVRVGPLPSSGA